MVAQYPKGEGEGIEFEIFRIRFPIYCALPVKTIFLNTLFSEGGENRCADV